MFLRISTKRTYVDEKNAIIPPRKRIDMHLEPPSTDVIFLCMADMDGVECDDIVKKGGKRMICDDCWNSAKCKKEIQPK